MVKICTGLVSVNGDLIVLFDFDGLQQPLREIISRSFVF